ncbi:MAG: hypothetical protein H7836_01000 [Magnetococcus sp. YQC-3]
MPELKFQLLGAKKKPVEVIFRKEGNNMTARCSCSAGTEGVCQHQINLLSGSADEVISHNKEEVAKLAEWIAGTDVGRAMHDVLHASVLLQNATEDFNAARKQLTKALRD